MNRYDLIMMTLLVATVCGITAVTTPDASAAILSGRVVVLPDARPGNGIWLTITRIGEITGGFPDKGADPRQNKLTAYTDSRGTFQLSDLPSGIYEIAIEPDSLPNWLTPESVPKITALVSNRDRARVNLAVTIYAELAGQVRREEGGLVRGGHVEVYRKGETTPFADCALDDRGRFNIPGLDRGVQIVVRVTSAEGLYRRVETTPLKAGPHHIDVELANWGKLAKQRVKARLEVPRAGDTPLIMDWISMPSDGSSGFNGEVALDSEGRAEFESPPGIYHVRVREATKEPRYWQAERYFRVDTEEATPQIFSIIVKEAPGAGVSNPSLSVRP
jgi:hypothetical protein